MYPRGNGYLPVGGQPYMSLRLFVNNEEKMKTSSLLLSALIGLSAGQLAPLEIADGKMMGCTWIDGTNITTLSWNQRTRRQWPVFQLAQEIPLNYALGGPAPAWRISETGTDAYLLLTVYAYRGMDAITTQDIDDLAGQITELNKIGRKGN